jgi:hypothetical protein
LDVDVGAEPGVVGEIPAGMVRIIVDDDLVRVPEPAVDIAEVVRGYAEVEASKPEAGRTSAAQTPDVGWAEAAGEMAVLPWMVEVVVGIIGACVVAYPVVFVNVWGVRMAGMVDEAAVCGRRSAVEGFRAVSGGGMRSAATARMAATGMLRSDRKGDKRSDQE